VELNNPYPVLLDEEMWRQESEIPLFAIPHVKREQIRK
jgi:hypothetical protein